MPVDRGGLQYTIRIEDGFSGPLDSFVNGIARAKKALDSLGKAQGKNVAATKRAVQALKEERKESERAQVAARKKRRSLTIEQTARRQLSRQIRRQLIDEAKARIERQKGLRVTAKLLTEEQALLLAEKKLANVRNKRAVQERLLQKIKKESIRLTFEERRALGLVTKEELQLQRARDRLQQQQFLNQNRELQLLTEKAEVLRRINRADSAERIEQGLASQGRDAQGRRITTSPDAQSTEAEKRKLRDRIKLLRQFTGELRKSNNTANRVSFTFRRLFGILAAFAAARAIIRGFRSLISELIRFNASIEQAELGVATLFTAVGDVRHATGAAVDATQGLALAQREARRQVALLRRDALKTAATFENLLETFQIAIAPGLQAGLGLDQIRNFTIQISRAAAAIGLQQNQLAEEIRSILQGTIQARTTRIAVALGITNEDIRNAKEAGVLFEFLSDRFEAFTAAGEETLNTFNAITTNLRDAFLQLIGAGGIEFFDNLKRSLQELREVFVREDELTGIITPDPRAVAVVQQFTNGLSRSLDIARELAAQLQFEDLSRTAAAVGGGLLVTARLLAGIIQGFIEGVSIVVGTVRSVVRFLERVAGVKLVDNSALSETVALITTVAVVLGAVSLITGAIHAAASLVQIAWAAVSVVLVVVNALLTTAAVLLGIINIEMAPITVIVFAIAAGLVLAVAQIALFAEGLRRLTSKVVGFNLKWITFFKLIKVGIPGAFKLAVAKIKNAFIQIGTFVNSILVTAISSVLVEASSKIEDVLTFLGNFSDTAEKAAKEVKAFKEGVAQLGQLTLVELGKQADESAQKVKDLEEELVDALANVLVEAENDPTLGEAAKDLGVKLKDAVAEAFGGLKDTLKGEFEGLIPEVSADGLAAATSEARTLSELLNQIPGLILQQQAPLAANVELLKKLNEELLDARDALREAQATQGLGGAGLQAIQRQVDAEGRFIRENLKLIEQENSLYQARLQVQSQVRKNQERILSLSADEQDAVQTAVVFSEQRLELERRLARAKTEAALAEAEARRRQIEGFDDEATAARSRQTAAEEQIKLIEEQISAQNVILDSIIDSARLDDESRKRVLDSIEAELLLTGRLRGIAENLRSIERDRLELRNRIAQIEAVQRTADATESIEAERQRTLDLRIRSLEQEIEFLSEGVVSAKDRLEIAKRESAIRTSQFLEAQRARREEIQSLDDSRAKLQAQLRIAEQLRQEATDKKEIRELDQRIRDINEAIAKTAAERDAVYRNNAAAAQLEADAIREAEEAERRRRAELNRPLSTGFKDALRDAEEEAEDFYTRFYEITQNALTGLTDLISSSIVDAFDPSSDTDLRERFRQFLLDLAKQIIAVFVRLAIIKAALGLNSVFGGGGAEGGDVATIFSGVSGGPTSKLRRHKARFASLPSFTSAKGFTKGGPTDTGIEPSKQITVPRLRDAVRPKLDPRDTIPIFAAPGEWVVQAKAVAKYGNDVMEAINQGLVDPTALRAVAAITDRGVTRKVASSGPGFVAGGGVTATSGVGAGTLSQAAQAGSGPVAAIMRADDHLLQQILKGGRNAMLDWQRANNSEVQAQTEARRR